MSRCILVESCAMCPHLGEHQQCWANGQRSTMLPGVSSIPDWCPLPEAPDHFRELDELIDEARALHWQPLETAPKDGTKLEELAERKTKLRSMIWCDKMRCPQCKGEVADCLECIEIESRCGCAGCSPRC